MKQQPHGFSLMELMIVIAIIGILAAFSVPNYYRYVAKAKQTEVALNLASLHAAQQLYYLENNAYCSDFTALGWEPSGHKAHLTCYSYGFKGKEGTAYFKGSSNIECDKFAPTHANQNSFIACAAADLQGKGKLDIWTIDESKKMTHVSNGL